MMLSIESWQSGRLRLRWFRQQDAALLFEHATRHAETMRYIQWPVQRSLAEAQELAATFCEEMRHGSKFYLVAEARSDGRLIGFGSMRPESGSVSVGFIVTPSCRGNGYAVELLGLLTSRLLRQPGVERVDAWCDVENVASAKTLERGGFVRLQRLDAFGVHPNISSQPRDVFHYVKRRPPAT